MSFAEACFNRNNQPGFKDNPVFTDAYNFFEEFKIALKRKLERDSYKTACVTIFNLRKFDKTGFYTMGVCSNYSDANCTMFWIHVRELVYKYLTFLGFTDRYIESWVHMAEVDAEGDRVSVNWEDYSVEDNRRIYDIEFEVNF